MTRESLIDSNPFISKNPHLWKTLLRRSAMSSSAIEGIRPLAKDLRKAGAKFPFLKRRFRDTAA